MLAAGALVPRRERDGARRHPRRATAARLDGDLGDAARVASERSRL